MMRRQITQCMRFATLTQIALRATSHTPKPLSEMPKPANNKKEFNQKMRMRRSV